MQEIYFDQAASSFPKASGISSAVADFLENHAVNIGRGNYRSSYELTEQVLDARERLLTLFHAPEDASLCYTAGATASINQFLFGLLHPGDHIITSSVEHNAVMRPLHVLEKQGVEVTVLPCKTDGSLDLQLIESAIRQNTKAVFLTHASNVCGTILPIDKVGQICEKHQLFFGVDAAQTAGCVPINMKDIKADFLAFPGHKGLRGPQGVGGFVIRKELADVLSPLSYGGTGSLSDSETQPDFLPDKFESGTLPLPAIIGLDAAISELSDSWILEIRRHEMNLTAHFIDSLRNLPGIRIAGITDFAQISNRTAVVSIDFESIDNAIAAFTLEEAGIFTRVGLHCAPRAHQTLGTFPQGTVRFSFGFTNTIEEVETALAAIKRLI